MNQKPSLICQIATWLLLPSLALSPAGAFAQAHGPDAEPIGFCSADAAAPVRDLPQSETLAFLAALPPVAPGPPAAPPKRGEPSMVFGVESKPLASSATDDEIARFPGLKDPLRPLPDVAVVEAEDAELVGVLNRLVETGGRNGGEGLLDFARNNPQSRWAPAALLASGSIFFESGLFSSALDAWWQAWESAKGHDNGEGKRIADLGLAHFARLNARVGRQDRLETLLKIAETRGLQDDAALVMERAKEGYAMMKARPEVSFMCGPYALERIANLAPAPASLDWLAETKSPPTGFSLAEVANMAEKVGLNMRAVKRQPGSPIPDLAVVHWKVGHFGAVVGQIGDRYIVDDPTFEREIHASRQSMEEESSGYFLVPAGPLPKGWDMVAVAEANSIFGKGFSGESDDDSTRCNDPKSKNDCPQGMAVWNFHLLLASLNIQDVPVWHDSPFGPQIPFAAIYNERESKQPSTFTFTNLGKSWVSNWISYVEDDPAQPGGGATVFLRSGGKDVHAASTYNASTQTYSKHIRTGATLRRTSPNTYERAYEDGSKEIYGQYIGTTGPSRRVFLTQVIDPWGNAATLQYDQAFPSRIARIYDAAGYYMEFSYDEPAEPYLVTGVADPFGRTASFDYQLQDTEWRLIKITDIIGIESAFTYGTNGKINSLTTPYGRVAFQTDNYFPDGETQHGATRRVIATEKLGANFEIDGDREMVEYNVHASTPVGPYPDPAKITVDQTTNQHKNRNSFYWDKLAMRWADSYWSQRYSFARVYHWLRPSATDKATGILEWVKFPGNPVESPTNPNDPNSPNQVTVQGDSRIYFNYPNQPEPSIQGTLASPSKVGRQVEDANGNTVTVVSQTTYTAAGFPSVLTDPAGRQSRINYAANGYDIASVQGLQGTTWRTLVSYANYLNRQPRRIVTPGGVTTDLTLNARGQVAQSITYKGTLSITTTYAYDPDGRLLSISVQGSPVATYTYDAWGRVATSTDATGYTLAYTYDGFDRVTSVTHPDGTSTQTVYQHLDPVASKDRDGRWTFYTWNHRRELSSVRDPKGLLTVYEWCACGSLRRLIDPKGQTTTWTRDLQGRVTEKTHPDGRRYVYTHEPLSGRLSTVAYPMDAAAGQVTATYRYHLDGQLAKIDYASPAMADVTYTYADFLGRLTAMSDGQGATAFAYLTVDATTAGSGQLLSINGPWTDDVLGFTYDALGRPLTRSVRKNNLTTLLQNEAYTYDSLGRLATVTDDIGKRTLTYDGSSARPLSEVTSLPGQTAAFLTRQYTWQTAATGARLTHLKNRHGATAATVLSDFAYGYSPAGEIESWQRTLGQGAGAVTSLWEMDYDPIGQLIGLEEKNASGAVTKAWEWGYDAGGNRTHEIEGPALRLAGIGGANRLDRVGGGGRLLVEGTVDEPATVQVNGQPAQMRPLPDGDGYVYSRELTVGSGEKRLVVEAEDGTGNRTLKSYAVTVGGVERSLTHDINGNLVTEAVAGGKTRQYEWDAICRLTAIQSDVVPVSGSWRTEYTYDGQSRRVRAVEKTWNPAGAGSWVVASDHRYLWMGTKICQKRDATGAIPQVRYYDGGERRTVGTVNTDYHYTRDHLGSIREVVTTTGALYLRYDYTPWGERIKIGGTATAAEGDAFEWGFTGHHYHAKSGLHLALYRAYDANLGRWLSEDPLGEAGGVNLYGYVGNNSVNEIDVYGLSRGGGGSRYRRHLNFQNRPTFRLGAGRDMPIPLPNPQIVCQRVQSNEHHPIPMFMGGPSHQRFANIPETVHREFHRQLDYNLYREFGTNSPGALGGRGGSARDWSRFFNSNPGSQEKCLNRVLETSRQIDAAYGTNITQQVWRNLYSNSFIESFNSVSGRWTSVPHPNPWPLLNP